MSRVERRLIIGRAPDCDILLDDPSISRRHAELILAAGRRWLLIDRHSQNGTSLKEGERFRKISQEVVAEHDTVRFGDMTIRVAELLRMVRPGVLPMERPAAEPAAAAPVPEPWVRGRQLVRCACGAVKSPEQPCPSCGG